MTVEGWPLENAGAVLNARDDRRLWELLGSTLGGPGVGVSTHMQVTQRAAGANMSVDVAAGGALVAGDEAAQQGWYVVHADAATNVPIAASDPTNPRNDLIVARIKDSEYSGALNAGTVEAVTGTPAASPVDPTVPANSYTLARVRVNAAATSIVNANITDLRTVLPADLAVTGDVTATDTITAGTVVSAPKVRATATSDLTLSSTGHGFQVGPDAGVNLAMDNNEIAARNNGSAAALAINPDGGQVTIGPGGVTVAGGGIAAVGDIAAVGNLGAYGDCLAAGKVEGATVRATTGGDLSLSSTGHGLQVGPSAGANMAIDTNEVQARDNGGAADLYLNNEGGDVIVGDDLIVDGTVEVGSIGGGTTAYLAHLSRYSTSEYALAQTSDGNSYLNAKAGQAVHIRLGQSTDHLTVDDTTGNGTGSARIEFPNQLEVITTGQDVLYSTDGNRRLGRNTSSGRYKREVEDAAALLGQAPLDAVRALRAVSFEWDPELVPSAVAGERYLGLIAEDVAAVAPDLVVPDEDGSPGAVNWRALSAVLAGAVGELAARVDALEARLARR